MEDLHFNLAKEEFSKGRKILMWILAIIASIVTVWDTYLKFFKQDTYATIGLTITLFIVTAFLFLIAILATKKRKDHFFRVDNDIISYNYGLMFPTHHTYKWSEVKKLFIPPHTKNLTIVISSGKPVHINLTWIEKNKARIIRRHIFYTAKSKGLDIAKKKYKK